MKTPKKPKPSTCVVLANGYLDEFNPEVVHTADTYGEACDWVEEKLLEEPGCLYIIARCDRVWFADVRIKVQARNGGRWAKAALR